MWIGEIKGGGPVKEEIGWFHSIKDAGLLLVVKVD